MATRGITFAEAKATYIHRFTMEHVPEWASRPIQGRYYAPQYRSDREWYENTTFPGDKGHKAVLMGDKGCLSSGQTWPLGQWLSQPYRKGQK